MEMDGWFIELLYSKGIILSNKQVEQFDQYYRLLVEWNEKMNLTGITQRDAVYEKHFYDSVSLSFFVDMMKMSNLADIGSGAGFPSIPLKICFPHLQVTIVDSLNKRIQFLKHLSEQLELNDMSCVHGRAEDIGHKKEHRDQYDLVTARAVAKLNILAEFCLPFVKRNGLFIAMKGTNPNDEIKEASRSFQELKGELIQVNEMKLPMEQSERHFIMIRKIANTPKTYPRKAGTPLKQPIM